ncbi:hypothetical protein A1Q1_03500 [Trichosporon asahii var. asahii CBS 2479]|uniref:Uncharacterized protein n=1 Tax=Trichosporon asahii var. asahii (strain ATCC 90039 / CBS 2479 / JCM 2466 / KCTC 7840 / NBRC 103889/ NCYC 2677 / UAMH 7654) TaxID=1186058 RepID=J4UA64_TRIAS|nr:hypothetical protein A1Q1_03500 [Trichosporon asahii var. asahii CBS 2479]EJT47605.1 hypothetical protein A1Q1_03500 [Trichosporon asahii var. asahii CBS 2479]
MGRLSVADIIHRTIVFGAIGFGVYGSVVIGQNYIVKKRRKEEYEAQQKAWLVSREVNELAATSALSQAAWRKETKVAASSATLSSSGATDAQTWPLGRRSGVAEDIS